MSSVRHPSGWRIELMESGRQDLNLRPPGLLFAFLFGLAMDYRRVALVEDQVYGFLAPFGAGKPKSEAVTDGVPALSPSVPAVQRDQRGSGRPTRSA
jgi:hypothetical protein